MDDQDTLEALRYELSRLRLEEITIDFFKAISKNQILQNAAYKNNESFIREGVKFCGKILLIATPDVRKKLFKNDGNEIQTALSNGLTTDELEMLKNWDDEENAKDGVLVANALAGEKYQDLVFYSFEDIAEAEKLLRTVVAIKSYAKHGQGQIALGRGYVNGDLTNYSHSKVAKYFLENINLENFGDELSIPQSYKENQDTFHYLDILDKYPELANHLEFMISAIKCNILLIEFTDTQLKKSPAFFKALMPLFSREKQMVWILQNPASLQYANYMLSSDLGFLKNAVREKPDVLEFADDKIRNSSECLKQLIWINPAVLEFADDKIRNSSKCLKQLIQINPAALEFAPEQFKTSQEFIKELVKLDSYMLFYASNFHKDKEVVKLAVEQNTQILRSLLNFESFSNDKEMVKVAIKAAMSVDDDIFMEIANFDEDFIRQLMAENIINLNTAKYLVQNNFSLLEIAQEQIRSDKNFITQLVRQDVKALEFAEHFKDNIDVILTAYCEGNLRAIEYASERLKAIIPIMTSIEATHHGDNSPQILITSIKPRSWEIDEIEPEYRNDKDIIFQYLSQRHINNDVLSKCIDSGVISIQDIKDYLACYYNFNNYLMDIAGDEFCQENL